MPTRKIPVLSEPRARSTSSPHYALGLLLIALVIMIATFVVVVAC